MLPVPLKVGTPLAEPPPAEAEEDFRVERAFEDQEAQMAAVGDARHQVGPEARGGSPAGWKTALPAAVGRRHQGTIWPSNSMIAG